MTLEKRQWLSEQKLPAAAREQIDVALALIDALDIHSLRLTCSCARMRASRPVAER
jgi:hypothetical protein